MVSESFPASPSEISAARHFALAAAEHLGCCPADLGLVVSELATNACVHARSPFMVTVERHDACGGCGEGLGDDPGRGGQISLGRPGLFVRHRLRRANAPTLGVTHPPQREGRALRIETLRCTVSAAPILSVHERW
jgi:hypothetical protein